MLEKDGQPLKFTLKTLAGDETMLKNAEILQEQWKALGVEIELEQGETGTVIADMLAGNFEMTMMGIGWPEADILWMWYHSSMIGALNLSRVDNPELDEILNKTRTSVDPDERQEWVNEAQRYIVEQAYMVPLYVPKTYVATSNRIQDEVFSPINNAIYLDDAYIEAEP
jgi:peptide/nickel transport system substrate-binding protein